MKKIISILLVCTLIALALASCSNETDNTVANIGVMNGPTGMGMAKLMSDNANDPSKYTFEIYSAPTNATADLLNGSLDMLCLPTNTAATLASKNEGFLSVIAINCLGSLYLLTDADTTITSIEDLEGKTIYASVPSSTTGPIIDYILKKNNVNATVEFEADHDALVAKIVKNEASIAILPEPKATAAIINNSTYSIDLNLSEEWNQISDLPLTMGCIVVRNDFLTAHKSVVDRFLTEYKDSISFIGDTSNTEEAATMIFEQEILPKLPIAKKALANLYGSIVYLDGNDMRKALEGFYNAIELELPKDSFYYEK